MTFNPRATKCCERHPTLRVRPRYILSNQVSYVEYECPLCMCVSGPSASEEDAFRRWEEVVHFVREDYRAIARRLLADHFPETEPLS